MSCQHGEHENECELCAALDRYFAAGVEQGRNDALRQAKAERAQMIDMLVSLEQQAGIALMSDDHLRVKARAIINKYEVKK